MNNKEFLTDYSHEAWAGWMRYMFTQGRFNDDGTWTMNAEKVRRWTLLMSKTYEEIIRNVNIPGDANRG